MYKRQVQSCQKQFLTGIATGSSIKPVSYTHLDVYKRQAYSHPGTAKKQLKPYNANVQNINANNNNHNNKKNNYENKSVQQLTRPSTSKERGGEKSTTREKNNE